jgi:hypothetical protein
MIEINNRERLRQVLSFVGMNYKDGWPTDIDVFLEFDKEIFIFADLKLKGTELTTGQERTYRSLTDRLGDKAIFIIAEHETYNTNDDVIVANSRVINYRWQNKWEKPERPIMLKEAIDKFLVLCGKEKYIQ